MDSFDTNDKINWSRAERKMFHDSGQRISPSVTDLATATGRKKGHKGHRVHRTNQGESFTPKGDFRGGAPLVIPTKPTVRGHEADGFTIKGDGMPVDEFKKRSSRLRHRKPVQQQVMGVYRVR